MKIFYLIISCLFISIQAFSQQDGWHLYSKPSKINKILPDDTDQDALHIATDMGYIKKKITTNTIELGINLTSQDPAIGDVFDISLDPTSDDIAFALKNAIAIYNGITVQRYSYENSNLTIGEASSQFLNMKVEYAKDGSLYIFKEDVFGYQKFNNGVFETESLTSFQPQDIIENNAGTLVYFAGANNGLWELEKSTSTWANYTSSNSNLTQNFLTSFAIDASDNLFIGHYQGLDKLEPNGTFSNCSASSPIAVFEISISPTSNDILVRNSAPNSANTNGLSIIDYDSCSWTNYVEDGSNCLEENVYSACAYGGNGLAYVAPHVISPIPDIGNVLEFNTTSESCSLFDVNYLNAPVTVNSNVVSDIAIRNKSNGNLEIGFTRTNDLHVVEIDPNSFSGTLPNATTLTPSPGEFLIGLIGDNEYFIVEKNTGWDFINESNNATSFNHGLTSYLAIITKKSTPLDSNNNLVNLIHMGFDALFNYRVYKTQCDVLTGTCSASEEIFTNNRDLSQFVSFGVSEDIENDEVVAIAVKTNSSGDINRTKETWSSSLNGTPVPIWEESHPLYPIFDVIVETISLIGSTAFFVPDENTLQDRTVDPDTGNPVISNTTFDTNNDGSFDRLKNIFPAPRFTADEPTTHVAWCNISPRIGADTDGLRTVQLNSSDTNRIAYSEITDMQLNNNLPNDLIVKNIEVKTYNTTDALVAMFTNYGLLIKTGIDISGLALGLDNVSLDDNRITLYPNPANDIVSFSNKSIDKIEVYDLNGRLVSVSEGNSMSINSLSKGIYIVKGESPNKVQLIRKLIKE